jgi:hypothetical protein
MTYEQGAIAAMEESVKNRMIDFRAALQQAFLDGVQFGLKQQLPHDEPHERDSSYSSGHDHQ